MTSTSFPGNLVPNDLEVIKMNLCINFMDPCILNLFPSKVDI